MKEFSVLQRDLDIHQNYLLEASAGTGKTFSIENLVVRLLVEEPVRKLDEMLIVTFTRAATRDLKVRVRGAIEKARETLFTDAAPDYLQAIENKEEVKRRLERALFCFDQAEIFTIHGFCKKALTDHGLIPIEEEEQIPTTAVLGVIRDFFRTEVRLPRYHIREIQLLLKAHKQSQETLERALLPYLMNGKIVVCPPTFEENQNAFQKVVSGLNREEIIHEISKMRGGKKKDEYLQSAKSFFEEDFTFAIMDQLPWLERFPDLKKKIIPLIHPTALFARVASDCQQLLKKRMEEEGKFRFDDLLLHMVEALKEPAFAESLRKKYSAAIVDEFQDTDPIQWKIFQTLFLSSKTYKGHLYLVGDPKQSIYSFRNADIYTYLEAAKALGEDHIAHLTTNYRSEVGLIEALNTLFEETPNFISLPRLQRSLPYIPVKASSLVKPRQFSDDRGNVHLMVAEEGAADAAFFPFIADEIQDLQVPLDEIAILVSDRFQADRLAKFLHEKGIPSTLQRHTSLNESPALQALEEVLECLVKPKSEQLFKRFLGSKIIGWTDTDMITSLDEPLLEKLFALRATLLEKGFGQFFLELLKSQWKDDGLTVQQRLLSQGKEFYRDLLLLSEQVLDFEAKTCASLEKLLHFLQQFPLFDLNQEERIKSFPSLGEEAVAITTMHSSKGLEYEIVFALGIVKPTKPPSILIPVNDQWVLNFDENSPPYCAYCEELDAEKMRQLYVALTRAKHRLYVPIIPSSKEAKIGCASPQELFFSNFQRELSTLCQEKREMTLTNLKEWKSSGKNYRSNQQIPKLIPTQKIEVTQERLELTSFTSLTKTQCQAALQSTPPRDWSTDEKTIHTLPAGSETGNLLHTIFEYVPLQRFQSVQELLPFVDPHLKGTKGEVWNLIIAEMVLETLKKDLNGFSLEDLNQEASFREIEFLYPENSLFLKGIIDMMFFHQGKYYLLDWKSNWLGEDRSFYHQKALEKAMEEHQYNLQAKIYKSALQKYLAVVDPRPFDEIFGGVFYVFLRGGIIFLP